MKADPLERTKSTEVAVDRERVVLRVKNLTYRSFSRMRAFSAP